MRGVWLAIGWTFAALGVIGIALPVMPTVPFLLVAAWAFARSSPALQKRILDHPSYGPHVRAWQEKGAVGRLAKAWAILAMAGGVGLSVYLGMPIVVIIIQAAICSAVGVFLLTRPTA